MSTHGHRYQDCADPAVVPIRGQLVHLLLHDPTGYLVPWADALVIGGSFEVGCRRCAHEPRNRARESWPTTADFLPAGDGDSQSGSLVSNAHAAPAGSGSPAASSTSRRHDPIHHPESSSNSSSGFVAL